MKASSILKFWRAANVVQEKLFPGRVRVGGSINGTVLGPTGVSLGGLSVEEKLMSGGIERKRGGTIRVAKTSWPDALPLPVENSVISIQESNTEIVADWDAVAWQDFTVKQVRGYQATEPAWVIDFREE